MDHLYLFVLFLFHENAAFKDLTPLILKLENIFELGIDENFTFLTDRRSNLSIVFDIEFRGRFESY